MTTAAPQTLQGKRELLALRIEANRRKKRRKIYDYYPETGPLRRELYPKHMEFFEAGARFRERGFIAGNRIGKTEGAGGYEMTWHLTGIYPDWWMGRRFDRPVKAWASGTTNTTTRDIVQAKMLGPIAEIGTGLIPGDLIKGRLVMKRNVPEAVETVRVKHASGGTSVLTFKSYESGRKAYEGTEIDVIWNDEEPPADVYAEELIRTADTGGGSGIIMNTFTPLEGMSDVVMLFLPEGKPVDEQTGGRYVIMAGWDDVPHLSEKEKAELIASMLPHQRDARTKGIPALGAGAIYQVPESDIVCDPFETPESWPRVYGLDVGWNCTAVPWGAWDRETDIVYITDEYRRGHAEPAVHAAAIHARGKWIPGVIDPAANGRNQRDGTQLLAEYLDLDLDLTMADNGVEAGILAVYKRLSTGRLKVFRTCQNWLGEYRLYRRNEKGKVVKINDHLMDATRYLIMSGLDIAELPPSDEKTIIGRPLLTGAGSWMR